MSKILIKNANGTQKEISVEELANYQFLDGQELIIDGKIFTLDQILLLSEYLRSKEFQENKTAETNITINENGDIIVNDKNLATAAGNPIENQNEVGLKSYVVNVSQNNIEFADTNNPINIANDNFEYLTTKTLLADTLPPIAPIINQNNADGLSGTAEPGTTIEVKDEDGNIIGETTADANGDWAINPNPLSEGQSGEVTATDESGNTSEGTSTGAADLTAPEAPTVETNNKEGLSGTAEPDSVIEVKDADGNVIDTTKADENGDWAITPNPLEEGETGTVVAKDAAGNPSEPTSTGAADVTAPDAPVVETNNKDGLSGTAEPDSVIEVKDADGNVIDTTTTDENGDWAITPNPLEDGQVGEVTAKDKAGNISDPTSTNPVDDIAPEKPTVDTNNKDALSGTAEPDSVIEVKDADGNVIDETRADENGDWAITPNPFEEGAIGTVEAKDEAGNTSEPTLVGPADITTPNAPVVETNNLDDGITGTAEPKSTITIVDPETGDIIDTTTADDNGNWAITPNPLEDGQTVDVIATDAVGNVSEPTSSKADLTPTDAPEVSVDDNTNDTTPAVTVTLPADAKAGDSVKVYDGDTLIAQKELTADDIANGSVEISPETELSEGTHPISATVVDEAGNESNASTPVNVVIDTTPTAAPEVSVDDNTNDTTPAVTVTLPEGVVAGDSVKVYDGDTLIAQKELTADDIANGSVELSPEAELSEGIHPISATVVDEAGTESNPSNSVSVTIDTTAPEAPTVETNNKEGLSGTAEPDSVIEVKDADGNVIDTTRADANGDWAITPNPLEAGETGTVVAKDAAGNPSEPTSTGEADVTAPDAPVVDTNNADALGGTAEPGTTVALQDADGNPIYNKNGTPIETKVNPDGTWSFAPNPLEDGEAGQVVTSDAAGNVSEPTSISNTDTTAPNAPVVETNNLDDGITGTAEPKSTITIVDPETGDIIDTTTADDNGNWAITPNPLEDGQTVDVIATDEAGNPSEPTSSTADTTAPKASDIGTVVLMDDIGSITGKITDGTITDDTVPTFSGTGASADIKEVNIYDGDTLLGTATVINGTWNFEPTQALSSGDHSFTAKGVDESGNEGEATTAINFTVSGSAPTAPAITGVVDDEGSVTGAIGKDAKTDDTTPTISGTGTVGTTVKVYADDVEVGSTTVDDEGNWRITTEDLGEDGVKNLTAQTVDAAGQVSPMTGVYPVVIDTTAPSKPETMVATDDQGDVTGSIEDGATTDDATPTMSGTGTVGDTVNVYNNGELIGTTEVDKDGNWTFTPDTPLANGDHALTTTQTDSSGNTSESSDPLNITVDTSSVIVSIDKAQDNVGTVTNDLANNANTDDTTPTLMGTASANATITIKEGDTTIGTTKADENGTWSYTLPEQTDGTHTYSVDAENAAGTVGAATFTLTVDTATPSVPTIGSIGDDVGLVQDDLANNATTDDTTPTVSGSDATPGDTIKVYDGNTLLGTTKVDENGNWSYTPTSPLAEGDHAITVSAVDPVGNEGEKSSPFNITVDTTAPEAPTVETNNKEGLSGTAEPDSVIEVKDADGNVIDTTRADANGDWAITPNPLEAGETGTVVAKDAAGNPSEPTSTGEADVTAPDAPVVDTNNADALGGTAEPGTTVALQDADGNPIYNKNGTPIETKVNPDGTWSFAPNPLEDGEAGQVVASDAAGNVSEPTSVASPVTLDAPEVSVDDNTNDTTPAVTVTLPEGVVAGDSVKVYDGDTLIAQKELTADDIANGSVELSPETELSEGTHEITATVENQTKNESAPSTPVNVVIDTTPTDAPEVSVDDNTNDTTPAVTVTLPADAVAGDSVKVYADGEVVAEKVLTADDIANGTVELSPEAELSEGIHPISATVVDEAGNESDTSTLVNVTIDTTPTATPEVSVDDNTNDTTPAVTVTLPADAKAGDSVKVYADGEVVAEKVLTVADIADKKVELSPSTPLSEGTHEITATVVDEAGTESNPSNSASVTIDTTAPSALTVSADANTNDTTPDVTVTLSNDAVVGDTINLYDGDVVVAQKTLTGTDIANGTLVITPEGELNNGEHAFTATLTDEAGNESTPSNEAKVNINTVPPEAVTLEVSELTSDATPAVTAVLAEDAKEGDIVTLYEGDSVIGTATLTAQNITDGNVVIDASELSDGEHTLTATITNAANVTSDLSSEVKTTIDTTAPDAPIVETNNLYGISGTAEAKATITFLYPNGNPITDMNGDPVTTVADENGAWSVESTPFQDTQSVLVKATDSVGNVSDGTTAITDKAAPAQLEVELVNDTGSYNNDNITYDPRYQLVDESLIEDGATVEYRLVSTQEGFESDTGWTTFEEAQVNQDLDQDGVDYTIYVRQIDKNGNVGPENGLDFNFDNVAPPTPTEPPYLEVTTMEASVWTNDSQPSPRVQLDPLYKVGNIVTLYALGENGEEIDLGSNIIKQSDIDIGSMGVTPSQVMEDGEYTVVYKVFDVAGNVSGTSPIFEFGVDTIIPDQPEVLVNNMDELSGTAESKSTITISDKDGNEVAVTTTDANGNWSFEENPLVEGEIYQLKATDHANNDSDPVIINDVDTTAPNAPVVETNNLDDGITGTAEPKSTITIVDPETGDIIDTTTADDNGNWAITPNPLEDGQTVDVIATDAVGNVSEPTSSKADLTPTDAPEVSVDDNTNDTTPAVTVTLPADAKAGDSVKVYDGDTLIAQKELTADDIANGSVEISPETELSEGTHPISATVVDEAGNESNASTPVNVVIDTTPTAAPEVSVDDNTNDTTPAVTVTLPEGVVAGDSVKVYDGDTLIAQKELTADDIANGSVELSPEAELSEGIHPISATVVDEAGTESNPSNSVSVTIDTTPTDAPEVSVDDNTNDTTPAVTVTLPADAVAGDSVKVYADGEVVAEKVLTADDIANGTVELSPEAELSEGIHPISATVVDEAGNESDTSTLVNVTIDTTPTATPEVSVDDNTNDTTPAVTVTLPADAKAGDSVKVYADGEVVAEKVLTVADIADKKVELSPSTPLSEGTHEITATVVDEAGTESNPSNSASVTIDTTAPSALTVSADANTNDTTPDVTVTLSNDAVVGDTINLYDGDVVVAQKTLTGTDIANGTLVITPEGELNNGEHAFTATLTDEAGNESTPSNEAKVNINTVPPEAVTLEVSELTSDATPAVTAVLAEDAKEGDIVTLYEGDSVIGTATLTAQNITDGNVVIDASELSDGEHTLTATITNAANVTSDLSSEVKTTIDTTAPDAPIVETNNLYGISGTAEAKATITFLYPNGNPITDMNGDPVTTVADENGAWSVESTPFQDTQSVLVKATDSVGNVSDGTTAITDKAAPAQLEVELVNDTGSYNNDNITYDPRYQLVDESLIEDGATVEYRLVSTQEGFESDTGWTTFEEAQVNQDLDQDGVDYTIYVRQIDKNGNVGPENGLDFNFDNVAPPTPTEPPYLEVTTMEASVWTNDSQPSPRVQLDPLYKVGNIVTLYALGENGEEIDLGSNIIKQSDIDIGSMGVTPSQVMEDGEYTVVYKVFDVAGNVSGTSPIFEFGVDTIIPDQPEVLVNNMDELSGTAEANSTITISDKDANVIAVTTTDANGNWSLDENPLVEGEIYQLKATDHADNDSIIEIVYGGDQTPPATIEDAALTSDNTIVGTSEPLSTVVVKDADGNEIARGVTDENGNFVVNLEADMADPEAVKTWSIIAIDTNNNPSAEGTIETDITAPNAPVVETNNLDDGITGTAEPKSTITIVDPETGDIIDTTTADDNGYWSITPNPLEDGQRVDVIATDAVGNESEPTSSTADTTAPIIAVDTNNGAGITGTGEVGTIVNILNPETGDIIDTATVDNDGNWSIEPNPLEDGQVAIAVGTDKAGNDSLPIILDPADLTPTGAPEVSVDDNTNDTTPAVTVTLPESAVAGDSVKVYDGDTLIAEKELTADDIANGTVEISPDAELSEGTHPISATIVDEAGNESEASTPVNVTIDTTAPNAPVITQDNASGLFGTAEPLSTVALQDENGNPIVDAQGNPVTATTDADGNWSIAPSPLEDGQKAQAVATDTNDNTSAPVAIPAADRTAPDAPIVNTNNAQGLSGTAEANAVIIIRDPITSEIIETTIADDNGNWSVSPNPLQDGAIAVVTATDEAENVSVPTITDPADITAPDAPELSINNEAVRVSLTNDVVAGDTIKIFTVDGNMIYEKVLTSTDISKGYLDYQPTNVDAKDYILIANVTDEAVNVSEFSNRLYATVDSRGDVSVTDPTLDVYNGDSGNINAKTYATPDGGFMLVYLTNMATTTTSSASYYDFIVQKYDAYGQPVGNGVRITTTESDGYADRSDMWNSAGSYDVTVHDDGSYSIVTNYTVALESRMIHVDTNNNVEFQYLGDTGDYSFGYNMVSTTNGDVMVYTNGTIWDYDITARASGDNFATAYLLTNEVNGGNGYIYNQYTTPTGYSGFGYSSNIESVSAVSLGGSKYAVLYSEFETVGGSTPTDMKIQVFDYNGVAISTTPLSTVVANSETSGWQIGAKMIALADGTFVTVWASNHDSVSSANEYGTMDGFNLYARTWTFDEKTNKLVATGSEFMVNTTTDGVNGIGFDTMSTGHFELTALTNGNYVVVWQKFLSESLSETYSQTFDANGNKVGSETLITTNDIDNAPISTLPDVLGLDDGGYVISWTSYEDTTTTVGADAVATDYAINSVNTDVKAVIFNADGTYRYEADATATFAIDNVDDNSTLVLDNVDTNVDFDALAQLNENIGKIDMSEGDFTINDISLDDVLTITDDNNELVFVGEDGDSIDLTNNDEWEITNDKATVEGEDGIFVEYSNKVDPTAKLVIDEDVSVI